MFKNTIRRSIVLLVLSAVLATTLASAAGPERLETRVFRSTPIVWLWSVLMEGWTKAGCRLDPNGYCLPSLMQTEEGCRLDPDGCQSPRVETDNGCRIDPSGCEGGK